MINPDLVEDEMPQWVNNIVLGKMLRIPPWEVEMAPLWWKARIVCYAKAKLVKSD